MSEKIKAEDIVNPVLFKYMNERDKKIILEYLQKHIDLNVNKPKEYKDFVCFQGINAVDLFKINKIIRNACQKAYNNKEISSREAVLGGCKI